MRQRGDTIVEVMLAMAVVGLTLGVAYGIANRATNIGRQAQERTEALKIAESQLELLKANINSGAVLQTTYEDDTEPYCVTSATTKTDFVDSLTSNVDADCVSGLYELRVEYVATPLKSYTSIVEWEVPSSPERARVTLVYRP